MSSNELMKFIKKVALTKSLEECYQAGFDCGFKGVTEDNCHFSFFASPEKTKEWDRGKKDGEKRFMSLNG
jgi:hypothetical protein